MQDPHLGEIMLFAGNFAPAKWAFCNGQLLPIAQNQALFSVLGTTYGGDGKVNFALPDLRGRAPIGMGHGPGLSNYPQGKHGGVENVTLLSTQMPVHTHQLSGVTFKVKNAGYVDIPVNTEEGEGNSIFPTNILAAGDSSATTPKPFTNLPFDGKYSGNGIPVQGMQIEISGGQIGSAGGSQPLAVVQPYLGMNYCIALEGLYPPRP